MHKALLITTAITALSFAYPAWAQERGGGMGGPGGETSTSQTGRPAGNEEMTAPQNQATPGAEKGMKPATGAQEERGMKPANSAEEENGMKSGNRAEEEKGMKPGNRAEEENAAPANKGGQENRQGMQGREQGQERATSSEAGEKGAANITSEQRTKVQSSLRSANIRDARNVEVTNVRVGVSVPRTVTEYWEPVPASILEIVPAWRSYRVVRIHDEVVIIDPRTFEIVYILA